VLENLNTWEIAGLVLLAFLIFGDKLPKVISDGLRMVRNLRKMAQGASSDLSRQLGTEVTMEDLNPKAFLRKHLLSEEDEAALRTPLQSLYQDIRSDVDQLKTGVSGVGDSVRAVKTDATAAIRRDLNPLATDKPHLTPQHTTPPAPAVERSVSDYDAT